MELSEFESLEVKLDALSKAYRTLFSRYQRLVSENHQLLQEKNLLADKNHRAVVYVKRVISQLRDPIGDEIHERITE